MKTPWTLLAIVILFVCTMVNTLTMYTIHDIQKEKYEYLESQLERQRINFNEYLKRYSERLDSLEFNNTYIKTKLAIIANVLVVVIENQQKQGNK